MHATGSEARRSRAGTRSTRGDRSATAEAAACRAGREQGEDRNEAPSVILALLVIRFGTSATRPRRMVSPTVGGSPSSTAPTAWRTGTASATRTGERKTAPLWPTAGAAGFLVSKNTYKDFQIRAEFWAEDTTNSGVYFRCTDSQHGRHANAYEANIYDQRPDPTYGTGALVDVATVPPMMYKVGGKWNTYEITVRGPQQTAVLNGVQTVTGQDTRFEQGFVALQYAAGPNNAPGRRHQVAQGADQADHRGGPTRPAGASTATPGAHLVGRSLRAGLLPPCARDGRSDPAGCPAVALVIHNLGRPDLDGRAHANAEHGGRAAVRHGDLQQAGAPEQRDDRAAAAWKCGAKPVILIVPMLNDGNQRANRTPVRLVIRLP